MTLKARPGTGTHSPSALKCARGRVVNVFNRKILQVTVCKKLRGSKGNTQHLKHPINHHDMKLDRIARGSRCALKEGGWCGRCCPRWQVTQELDFAYIIEFCSTGKGFTQGHGC